MSNIVHLFTPGVDSFVSDWMLNTTTHTDKITRVYFNTGCRYSDIEDQFLVNTRDRSYFYTDFSLTMGDIEHEDAHIPNRNLLFISMAQARYNADIIYINGVKDDNVSDNTFSFYNKISKLLSDISGKPVLVESKTINYEKSECCKKYTDSAPEEDKYRILTDTYSCFSNNLERHSVDVHRINDNDRFEIVKYMTISGCLKCPACFRKMCALTHANIFIPFNNADIINTYFNRVNSGNMDHTPIRKSTIIKAKNFLNWYATK